MIHTNIYSDNINNECNKFVEKNEFTAERNKTTRDFELRVQDILRAVKVAMAFAPKELWKCDPVKHEAGNNNSINSNENMSEMNMNRFY